MEIEISHYFSHKRDTGNGPNSLMTCSETVRHANQNRVDFPVSQTKCSARIGGDLQSGTDYRGPS